MWIKVCGNTSVEDALLAAESGADALGFVFAESPRRVTVEQVREIVPQLPGHVKGGVETGVETIGVFVDPDFDTVVEAVLECGLTGVQLHTSSHRGLPARLRSYFAEGVGGGELKILRALHHSPDLDERLDALRNDAAVDGVLVDSRTAKAVGGTGVAYDWQAARASFLRSAADLNLIAAGGLTPENVAEAIAILEPHGVDVVTGVESAPGKKDPARVKAFIQNALAAELKIKQH